jgi:hypothetical protein
MSERSKNPGRAGGPAGSSSTFRAKGSSGPTRDGRVRPSKDESSPTEESGRARLWGKTPKYKLDSAGLSALFESQVLLKAALAKQARLAKLDVSQVRSTETEHLRRVNQAILDASSSVEGFVNPFRSRNLIDSQIVSERMIRGLGKNRLNQRNADKPEPRPHPMALRLRGKRDRLESKTKPVYSHLEDCFSLRGPLLREFSRAKERGYKGPPSRWLKGPTAVAAWRKLLSRGITSALPGSVSVFHRSSPLHYLVNASSIVETQLCRGFTGTKLRQSTPNVVVLRRQAASVPRLKRRAWPRSHRGHAWPTFPTLAESLEMAMRSQRSFHHDSLEDTNIIRSYKVPTTQIKPGSSARAVSRLVLGIRADIDVPKGLLGHFRYRWGFLILRRHWSLPLRLSRWLASQWKADITRMFLRYPCRYNDALRRLPCTALWAMRGFVPSGTQGDTLRLARPAAKRRRPPRNYRCALATSARRCQVDGSPSMTTSSSDKSDDGVRLC